VSAAMGSSRAAIKAAVIVGRSNLSSVTRVLRMR
jgi:hypothetical protein